MTSTLLKKVERLRYLAVLLLVVCGYATADAQLSSDEISEAILVEGSVPVKWTNDAEHPWYIPEGESYIRTPEIPGEDTAFTTTLSFSYTSTYPTELTYDWCRYRYNNSDILQIVIDGEATRSTSSSSWNNVTIMIPSGSHTIEFVSVSTQKNYNNTSYWAGIRNLRVWECKGLESVCLKEGSLPLTFENVSDIDKMWITEDGYIRSTDTSNSSSISTTFTIDKPSLFAYEYRNLNNSNSNCTADVYIDGVFYSYIGSSSWNSNSVVLYPGEHTVEFKNWVAEGKYGSKYVTEIRNVRLDQTWYDVTLNAPGELGVRMTQVLEGKPIQNLELLKIKGVMNADDWEKLKLATDIKAIDFSESGITQIPDAACSGFSYLSTVMLPESLKSIGNEAFRNTNFWEVTVPASVESIGDQAWRGSGLRYITFEEGSQLKQIGHSAFIGTRLIEFDMPDSVETLVNGDSKLEYAINGSWRYYRESNLFANVTTLKKLHLSEGLSVVSGYLAAGCTSLEEVNIPSNATSINSFAFYKTSIKSIILPDSLTSIRTHAFFGTKFSSVNLPETLTSIGEYAFASCDLESVIIPRNVVTFGEDAFSYSNLKTVILNSHCWNMNYLFRSCPLERVVLPCATPPTRYYYSNSYRDPFDGVTKSNVTLVVPDFAFDTYRTDSYWYQFTNTVKGDEASINDYWAIRGTLNLNNTLAMQGNPSVEMMTGGKLTLDANSAQTFNEFTFNTSESSPAVVLSQSNSVKADRLVSKFYVDTKDKWFFFSPVTDVNMSDVTYSSTDSWVIRYYDGASRASDDKASGNWKNVPADGTLKSGQGYIIQAREAGWLSLPAASPEENVKLLGANQVTFDLADNACETEANAGWNFVANPYPTYYDIYYIDMQAPITVWTGSTYKAYSLNDGDRGDDTFVLRPMQPFFVQKSADTPDLSTGMPLVGRQINTTIDRSRAPRPVVVDENRHKLNLELYCDDNEEADDYTRVVLNEQASVAYETVRDASKFMSMDANVAQLYTLGDNNHPMAINERPYEDGNVALGVLLPAADRTYRISACRADRQAWLYDSETGIEFDLTEGDYIFTASKTGIDNRRFSIRFAPAVTAVEGVEANAVKVAGNVGSISVTAPAGATVAVFGTDGSVITNTVAEDGSFEIAVAGGVYVVKVNGKTFKTIVK